MKTEKEIKKEIKALEKQLHTVRNRTRWTCLSCNKQTPVYNISLVQDQHYVRPYGCSDGDYWKSSNEYYICCPKCQTMHRICESFVQLYDGANSEFTGSWNHFDTTAMYKLVDEYRDHFKYMLRWYDAGSRSITIDDIEKLIKENNK